MKRFISVLLVSTIAFQFFHITWGDWRNFERKTKHATTAFSHKPLTTLQKGIKNLFK